MWIFCSAIHVNYYSNYKKLCYYKLHYKQHSVHFFLFCHFILSNWCTINTQALVAVAFVTNSNLLLWSLFRKICKNPLSSKPHSPSYQYFGFLYKFRHLPHNMWKQVKPWEVSDISTQDQRRFRTWNDEVHWLHVNT